MKERELLELAAKAAGWSCWQSKHGYLNVTDPDGKSHTCCQGWQPFDPYTGEANRPPGLAEAVNEMGWNPLFDDGDALRLAVKLGINKNIRILIGCGGVDVQVDHPLAVAFESHDNDPYAATRRAIVRAAAEIGKEMK